MTDPKNDLIELAAAMRAAQILYFTGGRTSHDRDEAIRLERQWDRLYRRYTRSGGQLELFDAEEEVSR